MILLTENKREKIFRNLLTNSKSCAIIRMFQGDEENKKSSPQGKKTLDILHEMW